MPEPTTARTYNVHDYIPGHGMVLVVTPTAYGVTKAWGWGRERLDAWVPR